MEAAKLRTRLAEYYSANGTADPLRIEIPKGAYVPHWQANGKARRRRYPWRLALAGVLALGIATAAILTWRRYRPLAHPDPNPEALALYLKGRAAMDDRAQRASQALQYFDQAIEKSPTYALAYAGSADAILSMDEEHRLEHKAALDRAAVAAEKALQLDPRLPEAYAGLAVVRIREYRWQEAERFFHRAIELNPNSVHAHAQLGFWLLLPQKRWDEAIRELRRAVALDTLSSQTNRWLAYGLLWSDRYSEAEEQARKAAALDETQAEPYIILGQALYQQQKNTDAVAALREAYQRAPRGGADAWLACGQVRAGRREEALRLLKDNLPGGRRTDVPDRRLLAFYACLGDRERALESLEKMYAQGEPDLPIFLLYRELDWLRPDARFGAMLKKIGLAGS
jgi:tetratricopeptide (TPR) repeat protein